MPLAALAELPPVGTVVTKATGQVRRGGEPTQQYMLKHGAEMSIAEYRKYEWQPPYEEATERFASQVKLSADNRDVA